MRSIGMDLEPWVKKGLLLFQANRPTVSGLEMHLTMINKAIKAFRPSVVIVDPLTSFVMGGSETEVKSMVMRLVDLLKMSQATSLFTSLTASNAEMEATQVALASLID